LVVQAGVQNKNRNMRIIYAVILGFLATGAMRLHRILNQPPADWLARCAAMAILRMYALRGGIDEGAIALYQQWSATGRTTLEKLLETNRIPSRYKGYARLLFEYVPVQ
jgi:hypothetical protein